MQYGLVFPNVGVYGDVHVLADLAYQAEQAGWDGVFLWDSMQVPTVSPTSDPWIALAAVAMRTQRIKIGPQVAIPPRRRPWQLAREVVTLDHLSNGRLILGVGAGDSEGDRGFSIFGEEMDIKKRAEMLDESLAIWQGLWSGQPFSFSGKHYHFDEITFLPTPVQKPGIPIWVGWMGQRKKPMERSVRFDGASPIGLHDYALTPEEIRALKQFVVERRTSTSPFDIVTPGPVFDAVHSDQARARLRAHAEAGATWSLQHIWPQNPVNSVRTSLLQGPPSL